MEAEIVFKKRFKIREDQNPEDIARVYAEAMGFEIVSAVRLSDPILALRMAQDFRDIPIAIAVLDGKVYGAYIGNYEPYDLKYDPIVATMAIETGLFNDQTPGEVNGKPVTWWRNKRC
jgi:hypothetical protein